MVAWLTWRVAVVLDFFGAWAGSGGFGAGRGQEGSEDKDGELHGGVCTVRVGILDLMLRGSGELEGARSTRRDLLLMWSLVYCLIKVEERGRDERKRDQGN